MEAVAGPDCQYDGADIDALVGIARGWSVIGSWSAAGLLATLRVMTREDRDGRALLRRRNDLPEGWDDSLNYEVAAALAMGPVSAGNLAGLAHALGTRLTATGRLLASGALNLSKAKLIAATFEPLNDQEAARAEALIAGEVAGKTYFQVERLAWRAALAIAPDVAERRRRAAERERARVTVFREESGAVGLSGRDLPAAQALSGHARVVQRAAEYAASGAFPGQGERALQALAYLHLLNGVSAADAITFARTDGEPPGSADGDGSGSGDDGPGNSGPDNNGPNDNEPGNNSSGDNGDNKHDSRRPDDDEPNGRRPDGSGTHRSGAHGGPATGGGSAEGDRRPARPSGRRALPEVTVPLATLLGLAARPGENRLLGPLDPAMARDLALAAARSPGSHWEVTIVDPSGYATGHGIARPVGRRDSDPPAGSRPNRMQPGRPLMAEPSCAFPARINLTVTEALLRDLAGQPRPGAPPGGWHLAPRRPAPQHPAPRHPGDAESNSQGNSDIDGPWQLALPGGQRLTVRFDMVPTYECDHRYQVAAYLPGDRLRRLVSARDQECTFPTCSRPAHQCDFEHAVPYDQGGPTCPCNAGARSRRCHQVKQAPGWTVTQPRPGWHSWTTPTGRSYVQQPWRYPA